MNDEFLGQYFTSQPGKKPTDKEVCDHLDAETLAKTQKVIDSLELLKEMEAIDCEAAWDKVQEKARRKNAFHWMPYLQKAAAILLIPLLLFTLWQGNQLAGYHQDIAQIEMSTPVTLRSVFTLPDGTKVWMNGGSTLKYPTQFTNGQRLVELDGEAYFQVAKDKSKPFRVKTGHLYVEAVGTAFNCTAFSSDTEIRTVLTEGKVNIMTMGAHSLKKIASLVPNDMFTYNKTSKQISQAPTDTYKYTAWRDGKIVFENDRLKDVFTKLGRWYNVEFVVDPSIKQDYAFTGTFVGEEITQIMELIKMTTPIQFKVMKTEQNKDQSFSKTRIMIKEK
jgi:transmembrane sensor